MSFIAGYLLGTTESGSHDPGELYCDHNGVYTTSACWDRVTVNVPVTPSGYTFPNGTEYTDIVKVTGSDPITDMTADKRLCAEIRGNRHRMYVYYTNAAGTGEYQLYSNVTDLEYASARIEVTDSTAGTFRITYTFTYSPSVERTIVRTRQELIGYGASGHVFRVG